MEKLYWLTEEMFCLMLGSFLYAGKSDSDYIDALAYFDIQLHVFQSLQH